MDRIQDLFYLLSRFNDINIYIIIIIIITALQSYVDQGLSHNSAVFILLIIKIYLLVELYHMLIIPNISSWYRFQGMRETEGHRQA